MSGNDPKDTDSVETKTTKETSRRGFLAGSAVAVVGATVAGIIGGGAKAGHDNGGGAHNPGGQPVPNPHHSGPGLERAIVEAWRTWGVAGGYMEKLLGPGTTKAALAQFGVNVANPRVLREAEYNQGYRKANVSEIVYVLPEPPVGGNFTGSEARRLMAAVPFGM